MMLKVKVFIGMVMVAFVIGGVFATAEAATVRFDFFRAGTQFWTSWNNTYYLNSPVTLDLNDGTWWVQAYDIDFGWTNAWVVVTTGVVSLRSDSGLQFQQVDERVIAISYTGHGPRLDMRAFGGSYSSNFQSNIQKAIDKLPSSGGEIFIPPGTWTTTQTISITKSNVTLTGSGWASIIKASNATFNVIEVAGNADSVCIKDLQIQGAATNESTTQHGIITAAATAPKRMRIENVLFSGPDISTGLNRQIFFDGVTESTVSNCTFERIQGTMTAVGIFLNKSHHNNIVYNRINQGSTQGYNAIGLRLGSSNNKIAHNTVSGGKYSQISIVTLPSAPTDALFNIIDGNICEDLNASDADGLEAGIEVSGKTKFNKVCNNIVTNANRHGILVYEDTTTHETGYNEVIGNTVYKAKRVGIWLRSSWETLVAANHIYDCSQEVPGTYSGIQITSDPDDRMIPVGNRLIGNLIQGTTHKYGIWLYSNDSSGTPYPTDTVLVGNFTPMGTAGTIYDERGVNTHWAANLDEHYQTDVKGVSGAVARSKNLRGQATLNAGTGSLPVTFPTAEPDASYYILLTGNGNQTLWVTNKTVTGFTINRSSATGTRIVDWLLIR